MRKKILIAFFSLILLITGYMAVIYLPEKKADEQSSIIYSLFDGFDICSIEVENGYGEYMLTKDGELWRIGDRDADGAGAYITSLSSLSSRVRLNDADKEACGIEKPEATAIVTDSYGKDIILIVGGLTADGSGRYVMTDAVYAVQNETVDWLLEDKSIFYSKTLNIGTNINRIEINDMLFEKQEGIWYMTAPYMQEAKSSEIKKTVLDVRVLSVSEYSDKSPEECGLNPPEEHISTWDITGKKETVYFGNRENGLIYAMQEGKDEVCLVEVPEFLRRSKLSFINTLCYIKNIDEIYQIDVNGIKFTASDSGFTKNGNPVHKEEFTEFYQKLMGMSIIGEADAPERKKCILEITVDFKDGGQDRVEVFEYKNRYASVFVNGKCSFYISKSSAEDIAEKARIL